MRTFVISLLLSTASVMGLAQEPVILITPAGGIITNKNNSSYAPDHKVSIQTQSGAHGFLHQSGAVQTGTLVGINNGGYGSYGTLTNHNLVFSTNSQGAQVILNTLKFMGIGGPPFNALHLFGTANARITGAANTNDYAVLPFIKADNNGKLTSAPQTYYYSLPKSAFVPIIRFDENTIAESAAGGIYYTLSQSISDYLEAPVSLPAGAKITGAEFFFIDNSSSNFNVWISTTSFGSPTNVDLLNLTSTGASPGIRAISATPINGFIPFGNGATYSIRVFFADPTPNSNKSWDGENTQLIAAKLTYTY